MVGRNKLDALELKSARLEKEWRVTIQVPTGGVRVLLDAIEDRIPLVQGAYDKCLFVREQGYQQFRALEGSYAGAEGTIQTTKISEIVLLIPQNENILSDVFETVFTFGVQEEPTISVEEVWGSRSKDLDDKDNPNRYWNRADADELHGEARADPDARAQEDD